MPYIKKKKKENHITRLLDRVSIYVALFQFMKAPHNQSNGCQCHPKFAHYINQSNVSFKQQYIKINIFGTVESCKRAFEK